MRNRNKVIGFSLFILAFALWGLFFTLFKGNSLELFPAKTFEVYTLTDHEAQGFSTSEVTVTDSLVDAVVNIRSGKAFPFAGFGLNLMSQNGRPTGYMDLSRFDSLELNVSTVRMNSIGLRILTDDPQYSQKGLYMSYRPLETRAPAGRSFGLTKVAIADFKTAEWWLAGMGLEKDDGLTYLYRAMFLEVFNGQGTLRGIPDGIQVKSVRLWGENRDFKKGMFFGLGFLIVLFVCFIYRAFRKPMDHGALKLQMEKVARLLKTTDKSLAEIAIDVGEKKVSCLERNFRKVYKLTPLEYRRKK